MKTGKNWQRKLYLIAIFLQPQYGKDGTFLVSRKGTISMA